MPFTMPATPKPRSTRFGLKSNTQSSPAPNANTTLTAQLTGARWYVEYVLPPMTRAQAEAWCAFLARCNGRVGRFYGGDSAGTTPRGSAGGTPLVAGGSQTGTTLSTDGWPESAVPLLAGDYFHFATPTGWREMHKVVSDAPIAGVGYGEGGYGVGGYGDTASMLTITPPIRESPADNAALTVASATCIMRLVSDEEAAWDVNTALHYGIHFIAEEVFPKPV